MQRRQPYLSCSALGSVMFTLAACTSLPPVDAIDDAAMSSDPASVRMEDAAVANIADGAPPSASAAPPGAADASMTMMTTQLDASGAAASGAAPVANPAVDASRAETDEAAYGQPCTEPGALACTAMYPTVLLRCDEDRWTIQNCGSEIEGYCEPIPGPARAVCSFKNAEQCAGLQPGSRVCVGREVHSCEGDRTRLVEACEGDKPLCSEGACGCINDVCPELLATTSGVARQLALSGSFLYWIDDAHTLGRVPIAGGASATLATGSSDLTSLAADSRNVFWTESESGTVLRAALDGAGATPIATGLQKPRALALDAEAVYWISDEGTYRHVGKVAKSGGAATALVPLADAESLTVASGYVYVGGYGELSSVPVGGGTASPLTTVPGSAEQAVELASDGTDLYFIASNRTLTAGSRRLLGRVALSGGAVSLVEDAPLGATFAIDAQHVYFAHVGRLMRRKLDGTDPRPIFDSRSSDVASDIVVDSESIYFSVERSLYKLRKND
jgi:hypothetical protein